MPNKTHSTKVQQKQSCTTISKLWRHIFSNIMNMKRKQIYHNGHYVLQALQNKLLGKPYTRFISRSISSIPCKQKKENNNTTNDCYLQKLHLELASLQPACSSFLGKKNVQDIGSSYNKTQPRDTEETRKFIHTNRFPLHNHFLTQVAQRSTRCLCCQKFPNKNIKKYLFICFTVPCLLCPRLPALCLYP